MVIQAKLDGLPMSQVPCRLSGGGGGRRMIRCLIEGPVYVGRRTEWTKDITNGVLKDDA